MKKLLVFALVAFLLLSTAPCFGAVGVKKDGVMVGTATDLDIKGGYVFSDGSTVTVGIGSPVTEATTYTTLTTAQSGSTFIATSVVSGRKFNLPTITTSDDGIWFRFLSGIANVVTGRNLVVDPANDAYIVLTTTHGVVGQSIYATITADTADSYPTITVQAYNGNWYATQTKGSWGLSTTTN